jgi:hypothetical protein
VRHDEYAAHDATGLAGLVSTGQVTPDEVAVTDPQLLPPSTPVLRRALARRACDSFRRTPNIQVVNLRGQPAMSPWVDRLPELSGA